MKIGIDARFLESKCKAGVENYLSNLVSNLADIDKENEYVLYFNSIRRSGNDFTTFNQNNFKNRIIRIPSLSLNLFNSIWPHLIKNVMIKDGIDIAHLTSSAFPKSIPMKTVATIHDLTHFSLPDIQINKNSVLLKHMLTRTINTADLLIAVSESTKNDIVAFFPSAKDKTTVIHLGVEIQNNISPVEDMIIFKKRYKLGTNNILFVGSLERRKNVETLLKAFSLFIKQANSPYKLVLVGKDGNATNSIKKTIINLNIQDSVILTGYVSPEEVRYFYSLAEVVVFPSHYEGFGLPTIESMTYKVPVILSNIPVFKEVANDAAIYFEANNPEELCSAICKLTTHNTLREEMIARGVERTKNYRWRDTAQKTLETYRILNYS